MIVFYVGLGFLAILIVLCSIIVFQIREGLDRYERNSIHLEYTLNNQTQLLTMLEAHCARDRCIVRYQRGDMGEREYKETCEYYDDILDGFID